MRGHTFFFIVAQIYCALVLLLKLYCVHWMWEQGSRGLRDHSVQMLLYGRNKATCLPTVIIHIKQRELLSLCHHQSFHHTILPGREQLGWVRWLVGFFVLMASLWPSIGSGGRGELPQDRCLYRTLTYRILLITIVTAIIEDLCETDYVG